MAGNTVVVGEHGMRVIAGGAAVIGIGRIAGERAAIRACWPKMCGV